MNVQAAIFTVLKDLIMLAGTIVLGLITNYIRRHYTQQQIETAKELAVLAVTFVEEVAEKLGLTSSAKLSLAIQRVEALAGKFGIRLTEQQWETLIEAALGELEDIWKAADASAAKSLPGG